MTDDLEPFDLPTTPRPAGPSRVERQVALDTSPDADVSEVGNSIASAWHLAAEPYAPLRGVPGISWTSVEVGVEHVSAASAMATGAT